MIIENFLFSRHPDGLWGPPTLYSMGRLRFKCDGTCAEPRFRLSAKRTITFKLAGGELNGLLAAEVCAPAVAMLDTPCSEVV